MVKGISRRVVVVRPPDASVFEEAIFIVREAQEAPPDVLREACKVAEKYMRPPNMRRYYRKRFTVMHVSLAAFCGGGSVGLIWAISALLHLF